MTESSRVAARALWIALAAIWLARLLALAGPSTWAWGIDPAAYLPAGLAWMSLAAMGLGLAPAIGERLRGVLEWLGQRLESPSRETLAWLFVVVAAAIFLIPDRVGFTGDFLLRLSSAKSAGSPATLFPQALPLDLWLHHSVPHEIARLRLLPVETTARLLGALEAGGLALLSIALARRLGTRGAALAIAATLIFAGPWLALFTGLNKAFTELLLVGLALALQTFRGVSTFRGAFATVALAAAAVALHRAGLLLLPLAIAAIARWFAASRGRESRPRRLLVLALCVATGALAWRASLPVLRLDVPRGMLWPVAATPDAPLRGLDLANLILFLAPVLVLAGALVIDRGVRETIDGWTRSWCLLLALPSLLLLALLEAPQGYFRDWDMFAIAGALLAAVGALWIGRFLLLRPEHAWLGGALLLAVLVPSLQLLAIQNDARAGLRRARAFADARPHRSDALRSGVHLFLGKRGWDRGDFESAATHGRRAATLLPTPSALILWGDAERHLGNDAAAESAYVRWVAAMPGHARGWRGLALVRLRSGRHSEAAAAAESLLRIEPGSPEARRVLQAARDR